MVLSQKQPERLIQAILSVWTIQTYGAEKSKFGNKASTFDSQLLPIVFLIIAFGILFSCMAYSIGIISFAGYNLFPEGQRKPEGKTGSVAGISYFTYCVWGRLFKGVIQKMMPDS